MLIVQFAKVLRGSAKRSKYVLLALLLSLLTACQTPQAPAKAEARVRAYAEVVGNTLSLSLTLEGSNGQSLSGAHVGLVDPAGAWQAVSFSTPKNAYVIDVPALEGDYKAELDSVAAGVQTIRFPVKPLSPAPQLLLIRDGKGGDAKAFSALQVSTPINLQWRATQGASRYLVEARQAGVTLVSEVTTDTSLTLAEDIFTASDATVQIVKSN